jgi:peroxiredoxin Q/BCP
MAQLRHDYLQFVDRDVEVVVAGPEDAGAFADYWQKESLPFIGLPDPKFSVLKLYGQEVNLFKLGRMPAQVLIDKAGVARFVHYGHSMKDIPENEEILALADEINATTGPSPDGGTRGVRPLLRPPPHADGDKPALPADAAAPRERGPAARPSQMADGLPHFSRREQPPLGDFQHGGDAQ